VAAGLRRQRREGWRGGRVGGGKSGGNAGAPEGLNWSDGSNRIKGDNKEGGTGGTAAPAEPQIDDLGPSTNEPEQKPEQKDEDTAVAQNDDPKGGGQAGKPNPDAMPADDTSGGGGNSGPRAVTALSTTLLKAGPSGALRAAIASTPNPEDGGGGTPRSVAANVGALSATFLKAGPSGALRAGIAFTPSITVK
jgi:hypothetical protein